MAVGLLLSLSIVPSYAQILGTDDFDDNSKDPAKWGTDSLTGDGTLVEVDGRLEYRVTTPDMIAEFDEALRPWMLNTLPQTHGFDVIVDVFNNLNPSGGNNASVGLTVTSLESEEDSIYVELYRGGPSSDGKGFLAGLSSLAAGGDEVPGTTPTNHGAVTTGSVRLNYQPSTKIFTALYDTTGSGDGYQWSVYGSFGVGPSGGGTMHNSPWLLTQGLGFKISVGAYSEGQVVTIGEVYADNFSLEDLGENPPQISVSRLKPFASLPLGRAKAQRVSITNSGGSPLSGLTTEVGGPAERDYKVTQPTLKTLEPGASTNFKITFRPRAKGLRKATVSVKGSALSSIVPVSGKGKLKR